MYQKIITQLKSVCVCVGGGGVEGGGGSGGGGDAVLNLYKYKNSKII